MNLMKKTILILFAITLVVSCSDNRESWLQEYKKTKCSWAETKANFEKDSIINSSNYIVKLVEIKTKIKEIEQPVHSEIEQLNYKIGQVNIKYLNKSRKISDEQERINGHNSTPEYENRMDQNDQDNNREVLTLENKKSLLQLKLDGDKKLQELVLKQNRIQQQIVSVTVV
jgi:hypothetical protein